MIGASPQTQNAARVILIFDNPIVRHDCKLHMATFNIYIYPYSASIFIYILYVLWSVGNDHSEFEYLNMSGVHLDSCWTWRRRICSPSMMSSMTHTIYISIEQCMYICYAPSAVWYISSSVYHNIILLYAVFNKFIWCLNAVREASWNKLKRLRLLFIHLMMNSVDNWIHYQCMIFHKTYSNILFVSIYKSESGQPTHIECRQYEIEITSIPSEVSSRYFIPDNCSYSSN